MKKILYVDTETTGVEVDKVGVIQLSALVEIDGEVVATFNQCCKPFQGASITDESLTITNKTMKELNTFQDEREMYKNFINFLDKYIDKFDKQDKFIVAGYSVQFDIDILHNFFKRNKNNFLFSYIRGMHLDVFKVIPFLQDCNLLPLIDNNKLGTWCGHFGIELKAHDSLHDIIATRKLHKILVDKIIK